MPVPQPKLHSVATKRILLRDVVHDQLRDAIMDGTFAPSEVLKERELLTWLEVSRSPLREALNELGREGVVEMSPYRYTRVAVPEDSDVLDALHVLGVLNAGAVRCALPRFTSELRATVARMCDAVAAGFESQDLETLRSTFEPLFAVFTDNVDNRVYRERVLSLYDGFIFLTRVERAHAFFSPRENRV